MYKYHVRLTMPRDDMLVKSVFDVDEFKSARASYKLHRLLCGYEVSDKGIEHYHLHVETDYKITNFRRYLIKCFKINDRLISVSLVKTDNNEAYVCKDRDCFFIYKGYTLKEVDETSLRWQRSKPSAVSKRKKETQSIVYRLYAEYTGKLDQREIGHFVLNYYTDHFKMFPSDYQLRGIISSIYSKKLKDIHDNTGVNRDLSRFYDSVLDRVLFDF